MRELKDVIVGIDYEGGVTIVDVCANVDVDQDTLDIITIGVELRDMKIINIRPFKTAFGRSILKDHGYGIIDRTFRFKRLAIVDIVNSK